MKDFLWLIVGLSITNVIANTPDQPTWRPVICPSNSQTFGEITFENLDDDTTFFRCGRNGSAYLVKCPWGFHWDQTLKYCRLPTLISNGYKQARTVVAKQNSLCPLDESPYNPTYLAHENDCGLFYTCTGGFALEMSCPSGKHWSVKLNRCELPDVANCEQQRKQLRAGSVPLKDGAINADCPLNDDPYNPTQLPYPGDCTKFYKCSYGRSFIIDCPYGLHWNIKANRCDAPIYAQCDQTAEVSTTKRTATPEVLTTRKPTTRTTLPTTTKTTRRTTQLAAKPTGHIPVPMPQCSDPKSVQKFAIPGQCKKFLKCYRGYAYEINCREGREWSASANDCIDAALAGCSTNSDNPIFVTKPTPTTKATTRVTTTSTKGTTVKQPTSCAEGAVFISHESDCTKYYQCDNGNRILRECPAPLFWHKSTMSCQWVSDDC